MKDVLIEYDKNDMLQISAGGKSLFHGNEHDFNRSPQGIGRLLQDLGCRVYLKEVKDLSWEEEETLP